MKGIKEEVLEIITGSNLYGTNTPESDKDYLGVFIPEAEFVFGFSKIEEVDFEIPIFTQDREYIEKQVYIRED